MNALTVLEQLGYHPHEAKVYLAALSLGEATISELATQADMPRTTVQEVAQHLQKRGLLVVYFKKLRRYYVAENPEKLLTNLKTNEQAFEKLLPSLTAMRSGSGNKPEVQIYSGASEIKLIMDDMLNTKHNIAALISWADWIAVFGSEYMDSYVQRRREHFLKIRVLTPRTDEALRLKGRDEQELRHTRFLPDGYNLRRISNFIYGDKVAIVSLNKKEPTGILIDDPDVAYANLLYFEYVWHHGTDK